MADINLQLVEAELFELGIDLDHRFSPKDNMDYAIVTLGEEQLHLEPIWSTEEDRSVGVPFLDGDDLYATLYLYGREQQSWSVYGDTPSELAHEIQGLFSRG